MPADTSIKQASLLAARAAQMRSCPTVSEELLWSALRARKLGVAFRRQAVIGPFIVDFLAPKQRLVVEVDGGYHGARRSVDARRERELWRAGYSVLRLSAEFVVQDLPAAIEHIREALGL
jgi:very-short-patch-repair endonuclease